MIKIMFVCHGNICRSPMAEYLFKDILRKNHLQDSFEVASSATSREEIGNPVYSKAKRLLDFLHIDCSEKRARQITRNDYEYFDFIIVMEEYNKENLMRIIGKDNLHKVYKLLDFGQDGKDIDDPWYSGDFSTAYQEIMLGLNSLLSYLKDLGKC